MLNMNKTIVMGALGRDPETKNFPNNGRITSFSMATTEFWKRLLVYVQKLQNGTESPPVAD